MLDLGSIAARRGVRLPSPTLKALNNLEAFLFKNLPKKLGYSIGEHWEILSLEA